MAHLLVIRGPSRAGKSTLASGLAEIEPDRFVVIESDRPPTVPGVPAPSYDGLGRVPRRQAQVEFWGRLVDHHLRAGRNVLLDCDLQSAWEASLLAQTTGLQLLGPDVLVIRLGASVEVAKRRHNNLPPERVEELHGGWGAPHLGFEPMVETDGKSPSEVLAEVVKFVRAKWPS